MRTDLSTAIIAACITGLCACGSSSDGTLFHGPTTSSTGGVTGAGAGGMTSAGGALGVDAARNSGGSMADGGASASGGTRDETGGTGGTDASATGGATGSGGDETGGTLGASGGRSSGGASDVRDASTRDAGTSSLVAGGLVSQDCVDCMNQHCSDELATCEGKQSCKSLEKCVSTCATLVCATCVASDPFDYSALFGGCANQKCSNVCPTTGA